MTEPKIIPQQFQAQSNLISSYSFNEILTKEGYLTLYLLTTGDNTGTQYTLTETESYSNSVQTTATNTTTSLTFDSPALKTPRFLEGYVFFQLGYYANLDSSVETGDQISATLYKYSGSADAITSTITLNLGGYPAEQGVISFKATATNTHFKRGDKIRVVISLKATGGGESVALGHDPQNRDGSTITPSSADSITSSRVLIPFRIDEIGQ